MTAITVKQARRLYPVIDPRQFVVAGGGLRITMNEITKQSDTLPVVEKIQNIETEILPLEIQNIDAPLAPEIISGVHAAAVNEETDSNFRPLTEITEPYIYRIWPGVVIAFGLALTAAWICLLGYALVKIIEMAI
ncbi:MAG: hypothetical protein WBX05_18845 [Pseudolabrys sp.]